MDERELRVAVLTACGSDSARIEELLRYNDNFFDSSSLTTTALQFPLPDELFVSAWEEYALEAARDGVVACLRKRLPQFCFPIREGISQTEDYLAATRRGIFTPGGEGLEIRSPEKCQLVLHSTAAGRIPLLILRDRLDFVSCVQALSKRNEPAVIPESMGACMIAGFNNWDRIRQRRRQWEAQTPLNTEEAWQEEFSRLIPQKDLYQDRFILLSDGPYSGVPASALGLAEQEWRNLSLAIRREHECTHYFTRRVFGSMRNNLLDELIADYMGIASAAGAFRADWFLHFTGLEAFPRYREGGRFQNYRGDPPLSDDAFFILQKMVIRAAEHLERFDRTHADLLNQPWARSLMLVVLSGLTIEALASPDVQDSLDQGLARRLAWHQSKGGVVQ
jgi:hypothetical protein